jgi:hypothetical protein
MTADPLDGPMLITSYRYVFNSPLSAYDPSGLICIFSGMGRPVPSSGITASGTAAFALPGGPVRRRFGRTFLAPGDTIQCQVEISWNDHYACRGCCIQGTVLRPRSGIVSWTVALPSNAPPNPGFSLIEVDVAFEWTYTPGFGYAWTYRRGRIADGRDAADDLCENSFHARPSFYDPSGRRRRVGPSLADIWRQFNEWDPTAITDPLRLREYLYSMMRLAGYWNRLATTPPARAGSPTGIAGPFEIPVTPPGITAFDDCIFETTGIPAPVPPFPSMPGFPRATGTASRTRRPEAF